MIYPCAVMLRDGKPPKWLPLHRRARRRILKVVGGYDAGEQIRAIYEMVGQKFHALPGTCQIEPDIQGTEAVCYGLTSLMPLGLVRFAVQDEMVLPSKTGRHECGHGTEWVLIALVMAFFSMTETQARDYVRTGFWNARFGPVPIPIQVPATWQDAQAQADAERSGSQAQWMALPGETFAECFRNLVLGYFEGEKTNSYGIDLTPARLEGIRDWLDRLMTEVGYETVRHYEITLPLVNGRADRTAANPILVTESQRVALGLVNGRQYSADLHRIWLNGEETTLPDAECNIYEDTAVPAGQAGRWKLTAQVRRDFGGSSRLRFRISPLIGSVVA